MNTLTHPHTREAAVGKPVLPLVLHKSFWHERHVFDWVFAALVVACGLFAFFRYADAMDGYEKGILLGAIPAAIWLAWFWRPLAVLMVCVAVFALCGIGLYQGDLARADQVFGLKYFLSSQSAILWMSVLFFMSTIFYWLGMFAKVENVAMELIGSRMAWVAVAMALIGTMVRWFESYLIGADVGHIPVSNLYEVFVLFCWLTTVGLQNPRHGGFRHAGGECCRRLFAVVHGRARGA
jgi:hypothetical protein